MGVHEVHSDTDGESSGRFMSRVLTDLRALERMLDEGLIESDVRRIGAEQEVVLVDRQWDPAPCGDLLLEGMDDDRVTTEVARFNLEYNLPPAVLNGGCLRALEDELHEVLEVIRTAADPRGVRPLLTGILPTLRMAHLARANITPRPRYHALDEAISRLRGGRYELRIEGADDLSVVHDSVMLEGLNTSFQVHYQVWPDEFAACYNTAQAIAAPLLAIASNSPILFGKRLWRETRIAIFQQVVDTRGSVPVGRDSVSRVRFGERWVEQSALELWRDDVARFRALVRPDECSEDPLAELDAGRIPRLSTLQALNSTVYRWNRVCYGITEGRPHLRIENRVLPSGPSVLDEVANAAFWIGLMAIGPSAWPDLPRRLDFDDAQENFIRAAREGLASQVTWLDRRVVTAQELVTEELIPAARTGLRSQGVDEADVVRLLDVIEQRVRGQRTGASWLLESAASLKGQGSRGRRLACLTAATANRQDARQPVHEWSLAAIEECEGWQASHERVEQFMSTDLYTVRADDPVELVASIMDWERVRHIPVEDEDHRLVGLVSFRKVLRVLPERRGDQPMLVESIMARDPLSIPPETTTLDAIGLMREHRVSCLPVVGDGRLVGIVTEYDMMKIAGQLLEDHLRSGMSETEHRDP